MRRKSLVVFLLLSMLVSFSSCKNGDVAESKKNNQASSDVDSQQQDIVDREEGRQEIKFNENQVLFITQDRNDVEGDNYTTYYYNYKGDLIEGNGIYTGFYYENALTPAPHPQSGKIGFINKEGEFIIEPKYSDASAFSKDGLAPVCIENENADDVKWGFVDTNGQEVVPLIYDDVTCFFDSGYAAVGTHITAENTNKEGEELFLDMLTKNSIYGIINKSGNMVLEPKYAKIYYIFDEYFFCELESGDQAIVDMKGNVLAQSDDNSYFYLSSKHYGKVEIFKRGVKWEDGENVNEYVVAFDGEEFVEEQYEYEISYKNVATTTTGKGYGVTENGKTVIPFQYDSIFAYNDYFVASKMVSDKEWITDIYDRNYNKTAENLPYMVYGRSSGVGKQCMLPNGYFDVIPNNFEGYMPFGVIDAEGNVIVEPVFTEGIILNTYEGTGKFMTDYLS